MTVHWITSCAGKQSFDSWEHANRVLRTRRTKAKSAYQNHKQARADRASLSIYRCCHCHNWHIGGRDKRKGQPA